jgi:hypothetical protein
MMDFSLQQCDVEIAHGDIALCPTDSSCIAQTIATRLKIIEGEWFLDSSLGIPYFTHIFGHKRSAHYVRELIMPELLTIRGVLGIDNFTATMGINRSLKITFDAKLSDGTKQSFKESMGV